MTIGAKLEYDSQLSAGAARDAAAVNALVASLSKLSTSTTQATAAQAAEVRVAGQLAAQREALAAKASSQAAALQSADSRVAIQAAVQREAIAAKASSQSAAAKSAESRLQDQLAAKDLAQKNAAIAKMVQSAQAREAAIAKIESKGAQDRLTAEAKAEQQRVMLAQKAANDIAKAREPKAPKATSAPKAPKAPSAPKAPKPKKTPGQAGPDYTAWEDTVAAGAIEAAGMAAVAAAAAAVAYAVKLSEVGAQMAIESTSFREDTVGAFEAMGKSSATSERLYRQAIDLSIKLGRDPALLAAEFKRLSAAGFKDNSIAGIAGMLADVGAVKGEAKAKALETLLEKTQAKGTIDKGTITALVKQGVSQQQLYEELAKVLHKPLADIPALVKGGKIHADEAIGAITTVVEKGVGGAAAKMAETIPALITRIKLAFSSLFDDVDTSPIKDVLKRILTLLTGPEGAKLKTRITDLFGNLFELIFGPLTKENRVEDVFGKISDGVQKAADLIKRATPFVHQFVDGLVEGFNKVSPAIDAASSAFDSILGRRLGIGSDKAKSLGTAIGVIAAAIIVVGEAVGTVMGASSVVVSGLIANIVSYWEAVFAVVSWLPGAYASVDQALATFIEGIASKAGALVGSIQSELDAMWDSLTSAADEAEDAGSQIISNLVDGIESEAGAIVSSIQGELDAMWGMFSGVEAEAEDAGSQIVNGLVAGIEANAGAIGDAILGAAQNAVNAVKGFLGIASPSRLFHEMGGHTAAGFAGGIDAHAHMATRAANDMAGDVADAADGTDLGGVMPGGGEGVSGDRGSGAGPGGGGIAAGATSYNVNINVGAGAAAQAGGDDALAAKIAEAVEKKLREIAEAA
jgi:hypothetical protein